VRSSSHYVRRLEIFCNSFSALINQLPSCFVLCLSSCVCLIRLTLLTFVYCAFDMIQLKRYIIIIKDGRTLNEGNVLSWRGIRCCGVFRSIGCLSALTHWRPRSKVSQCFTLIRTCSCNT